MSQSQVLDISWGAIIKVFIGILIFILFYLAREIVLWFFFALAISILLEPAIVFLRRAHFPKVLAIVIVYLSIFGILGLLIYISAPIFISELRQFSGHLPEYFDQISPMLRQFGIDAAENFGSFSNALADNVQQNSQGIVRALMLFFGGLASTASILTMAFFLSLEQRGTEKVLLLLFPQRYEEQIKATFERVQSKVAGWFAARILACLFVGVASYIIFFIFGVKYAFVLALLSAFLNFIPYIGPLVMAILLLFFVTVSSGTWMLTFYVLIAVTIIQTIEGMLLTPLLMKKMTDIPPVLVLVSLFLGAQLLGFLGMIFAVPIFGIVYEFLKEYLEKKRSEPVQLLD
jgi:predicted PurR-regulated permease PerM